MKSLFLILILTAGAALSDEKVAANDDSCLFPNTIQMQRDSLTLQVGASAVISAREIPGPCQSKQAKGVTWTASDSSVISLSVQSDTSVRVQGNRVGVSVVTAKGNVNANAEGSRKVVVR